MIPRSTEYAFSTRLRKDDVDFWRSQVEPIIKSDFDGNRTEFLMDAVRRAVAHHNRRSK